MAIYSDTGLRIPPTDGQNLTFAFIQYQAAVSSQSASAVTDDESPSEIVAVLEPLWYSAISSANCIRGVG